MKNFVTFLTLVVTLILSSQVFANFDSHETDNNINIDKTSVDMDAKRRIVRRRPGYEPRPPRRPTRPRPPVYRPRPLPPRYTNVTCEVGLYDRGYRMDRFIGYASGTNYSIVKERACDDAMRQCRRHRLYRETCERIW